jgi:hypothetical protein
MYRILLRVRGVGLLVSAVVLVLFSATAAFAQGMYLKVIERDGRIYVFNIAANADRFEKSGEMGVGITRPGSGPNGETVVGDNERALQLYYFKMGLTEVVQDPPAPPPPAPPWRISGLVFGDYYAFLDSSRSNFEDQNGLWLRRIYFTYDHRFTPQVTTRVRLEMNSNGKLAGGNLTPYVKDAYFAWTFRGRQVLTVGIQPSLTFNFTEAVWGLRHIEKTPLDLYRTDSSRDTGATVGGPINAAATARYEFQFGNESGNNAETDKFKTIRFATRYEKNPGFSAEFTFGQYWRANDADRTLAQIFVAYRAPKGRAGFNYAYQKRRPSSGSTASDINLDIYSGFVVWDVKRQKTSLFLRVDRYDDPCLDCGVASPSQDYLPMAGVAPFTTTIAGLEYYIIPALRISPNFEYVAYSDPPVAGVAKPNADSVFRMTFYWVW